MILEIYAAVLLGILFGIFTGLIPGIHVNLIAVLLVSISGVLLSYLSPTSLAAFIIAMAITHSIINVIPAIYLGAPESETALGVLPGHQLLLEGKGYDAVKLTLIGSFVSLLVVIISFPMLLRFIPYFYPLIKPVIGYILITVIIYMIYLETSATKRMWACLVFFLSGLLGIIVFTTPNLSNPLFPMLSGLFGISMLIVSLRSSVTVPSQTNKEALVVDRTDLKQSIVGGTLAGTFVSFFPGMGPAQAAVIASQILTKISNYGFLILVGAISTVNMAASLATYYTLDKARNGAVIAVQQLVASVSMPVLFILVCAALVAGGISVLVAFPLTKIFSKLVDAVPYQKLCISVISLIVGLVFLLSGWFGFLILLVSTAIGIIPNIINVKRSHAMGCLLLPVTAFFML